jgi:hypothetical protein
MRKHLKRPSPAMGVALIALFIAMGGTTYAATGGNFILGNPNSATSQTGLTSNNAGKAVNITQQNTGAAATALGLNVPSGKTPFTVNSATRVTNLNADQLDGYHANGLTRTTRAVGLSTISFGGTPQAVATATLVVPKTGFVHLEASAAAEDIFSSAPCADCLIAISLRNDSTGAESREAVGRVGANSGDVRDIEPLALSWTFPASAGTRTYTLLAKFFDQSGGGGSVSFRNEIVHAHFMPFGFDGRSTVLAPVPTSSAKATGGHVERHLLVPVR